MSIAKREHQVAVPRPGTPCRSFRYRRHRGLPLLPGQV